MRRNNVYTCYLYIEGINIVVRVANKQIKLYSNLEYDTLSGEKNQLDKG